MLSICLRDLIATQGSTTALADLPEFVEILSRTVLSVGTQFRKL